MKVVGCVLDFCGEGVRSVELGGWNWVWFRIWGGFLVGCGILRWWL